MCASFSAYTYATQEVVQSADKKNEKQKAIFVKAPQKNKPLKVIVFKGVGRDTQEVQKYFDENFKEIKNVDIKVLDYKDIGLASFEMEILNILQTIQKTAEDGKKLDILHEKEQELLPQLRSLLVENLDLVIAAFGDIPLENVILVGHSLGGLISSVLVEVLGNSQKGQVQSLLTSMAPPVGFINCAFSVKDKEEVTLKTVFPWIMHSEMGDKDPIWPEGVMKMKQCFNVLGHLDDASLKHFSNDCHDGDHTISKHFNHLIKKALLIAEIRQEGKKDIPVSLN